MASDRRYTRISFRGKGVYVDSDIQQDVLEALNIFKEKISPRDALILVKALGEFLKTKDLETLQKTYDGINTFNLLDGKFSAIPRIGGSYKLHPEKIHKRPKKKIYFRL